MIILVRDIGTVRIVTLNRPEAKNAITAELAESLCDILENATQRDIAAVILTGAEGFFSSGLDLKTQSSPDGVSLLPSRYRETIRNPPLIPLIAAVEGGAIGGGFELALMCDFIVAASNAVFGLPEIKLGLAPTQGGVTRFIHRCPPSIVAKMLFAGARLTATDLASCHLFASTTQPGEALKVAISLAKQINETRSISLLPVLKIFRSSIEVPASLWEKQDSLFNHLFRSSAQTSEHLVKAHEE